MGSVAWRELGDSAATSSLTRTFEFLSTLPYPSNPKPQEFARSSRSRATSAHSLFLGAPRPLPTPRRPGDAGPTCQVQNRWRPTLPPLPALAAAAAGSRASPPWRERVRAAYLLSPLSVLLRTPPPPPPLPGCWGFNLAISHSLQLHGDFIKHLMTGWGAGQGGFSGFTLILFSPMNPLILPSG